ncbi:MAG TPA: 2-C-methyl-D-erythritol 4-phosphate cytidylyltransferase [Pseudonocardiaceae bacterium]|nr:2-C-methyl-D-erythritol 4-phosphate cytidylyltransferase [Pseudonocardiaceae bacterium]
MSDVTALVPVAGLAGQRASDGAPGESALVPLDGVPLIVHAVRRLRAADSVDDVVVVADPGFALSGLDVLTGPLADVARTVAEGSRVVLVHDPLRAFVPAALVDRVVHAVLEHGRPVVPVLPCSDTVKRLDPSGVVLDTPDRAGLRVAQTPLGYPAGVLVDGSVTAGRVPAGALTVAGDPKARRLAGAVDRAMIGA